MFKRVALILVLILALAGVSALAAEDTVVMSSDKNPNGYDYLFAEGDTLYIASPPYLGVWHPGEEKATDYKIVIPSGRENCNMYIFTDGGKLCAVIAEHEQDDDDSWQLVHTGLYTLTLSGGEFVCEEVCKLDWSDLTYDQGDSTYAHGPKQVLAVNGKVFILYEESDKVRVISHVAMLSIEDEELKLLDDLEDICSMATYKDGKLLLLQQENEDEEVRIISYDPEEEECEKFAKFEVGKNQLVFSLAYDSASDAALFWHKGTVYTIEAGDDEPKPLVTVPLREWPEASAVMLPDGRYAVCAQEVALVDINGEVEDRVTLTINDTCQTVAVDNAIQSIHITAPNITVRKMIDESKIDNMVENLMNQDDSVDIYVLPTSSILYDTLCKRGFMSRLDGDAVITEHVGGMYTAIQDNVTVNGHIVALPVEANVITMGFGEEPLKKLGLSIKDVPDNWSDLLDFMNGLKDGIDENDLHFVMSYSTAAEIRECIFKALMNDYRTCLAANPDMGFNNELLRGLLEKLDNLDLEALNVAEDENSTSDEDLEVVAGDINYTVVLKPDLVTSFNNSDLNLFRPVLMKVNGEDTGRMNIYLVAAFINPYSKHPEAAMRFMEELTRSLPNDALYTMKPGQTTPIRGRVNEKILQEHREDIEQKKRQLEKVEGLARIAVENELNILEDTLPNVEKYCWEISQRDIDWFRDHDDNIVVESVNWLDTEAELVNQYLAKDISPVELLETIDRKIRMMRMEGN